MYIKAVIMQAETDRNKFISDLQEIKRHLVFIDLATKHQKPV